MAPAIRHDGLMTDDPLAAADPFAAAAASAGRLTALAGRHDAAVVLGSGWTPAADAIGTAETEIPLAELGGFPASTVPGHSPTVRSVAAGPVRVLVFLGRVHLYEGLSPAAVVHGVRTAVAAGCRTVVLTNAAGDSPSYRCTRPRNTRTRTGPAATERTVGVCPGTVEAGNPPSSASGISVWLAPIASAAGVQPEPSTTAASCGPARAVRRPPLAAAAAKGSAVTKGSSVTRVIMTQEKVELPPIRCSVFWWTRRRWSTR